MPTIRLSWTDLNSGSINETGFNIYRDTSAIDPGNLPAVFATVAADVTTYDDTTATEGAEYYYVVESVRPDASAFTPSVGITVGGGSGYVPPAGTFTSSIPAGVLTTGIASFPLRIDLSLAENSFWDLLARSDGLDFIATDTDGVRRAAYGIDVDPVAKTGIVFVNADIAALVETNIHLEPQNSAGLIPPAAGDVYGQHAVWAEFDAVYLLRGNGTDESGNGRDLTFTGTPTFTTTPFGAQGGLDTTAAPVYGTVLNSPGFGGGSLEMFGVAEKTTETSTNQTFVGNVGTFGASGARHLLGERNATAQFTYYDDTDSWHDTGLSSAVGELVSLGMAGRVGAPGQDDGWVFANGELVHTPVSGQEAFDTLLVGTGRGTADSDWRGIIHVALFGQNDFKSNEWFRALHLNFTQAGGLFDFPAPQNPIVGME